MSSPLELVRDGELCPLAFLAILLISIGQYFVASSPALHLWGLRLAAAAFLAFCVYGAWYFGPGDAADWIFIILRGLLTGAITLGLAWIILPSIALLKRLVIDTPAEKAHAAQEAARRRREQRRRESERQRQRRLDAKRQLAEQATQLQQQEIQADSARRRTDARATVELTFNLLAPKLGNRFTSEALDQYVSKYMSDKNSPEDVERHGQELVATLQRHLEEVEPPEAKRTLEDLSRWLEEEKARIVPLPIDEKAKRSYIAALNVRFNELSTKLFEELEP